MRNAGKVASRRRRGLRARKKMQTLGMPRLGVFRSCKHIYAQVFSDTGDKVLVCASTLEKDLRGASGVEAATEVGRRVGTRAVEAGLGKVAFDRSGYKYHGKIKALADAARGAGLDF